MLRLAFVLLCAAVLIGSVLAVRYLKGEGAPSPPAAVLVLHAALGLAGFVVVLLALFRGLPHTGMGTGGFGSTAAILLALAFAAGLVIARATLRGRRPKEMLVGTHIAFAIAGFVMLLTLLALG